MAAVIYVITAAFLYLIGYGTKKDTGGKNMIITEFLERNARFKGGGSVVTYICCGEKVYSPIIDRGEADIIISFELLEAARNLEYLKDGGVIITNTQEISPMPVITGASAYPEAIVEKIAASGARIDAFDALTPAITTGNTKSANLVMLGRLSKYLDFTDEEWMEAIEAGINEKYRESCRKAFILGK